MADKVIPFLYTLMLLLDKFGYPHIIFRISCIMAANCLIPVLYLIIVAHVCATVIA